MYKDFLRKNWQIITFNLILLMVFILGYGRFGDVMVDCFREGYIPECILKGQVLYKDIFTIYAPFAYLFNALLFLIFGINLKVLYFAGFITTAGILNLLFKISNRFMTKTYSLGVIIFVISASVLSPNVFNMIFPYSYGMLYGILFTLGSVYFALNKQFPLAFCMYSFAVCSKYEFVMLLPALIWAFIKNRNYDVRFFVKTIFAFILPVIINFVPLYFMGMSTENLILSVRLLGEIGHSKTLHWFYSVSGLIFRRELLVVYFINFIKVFAPLWFISKYRNKLVYFAAFLYFYFVVTPEILVYSLPFILVLFIIMYRGLKFEKQFFVVSSLLVSLKVFFAVTMLSYGVFFLPFVLVSLFIVCPPRYKKSMLSVFIMLALCTGIHNVSALSLKNVKINTQKGYICVSEYYSPLKDVIEYVSENTNKDDMVIVYPESLAVNFLAGRVSDSRFYSLIPLYVEVFGNDIIQTRLHMIKPEYIILTNYDTSVYGLSQFGEDYAKGVKSYVAQRYQFFKTYGNRMFFNLYKLKHTDK